MSWPKLLVVLTAVAVIAVFGFVQWQAEQDYQRCLTKYGNVSEAAAAIVCED